MHDPISTAIAVKVAVGAGVTLKNVLMHKAALGADLAGHVGAVHDAVANGDHARTCAEALTMASRPLPGAHSETATHLALGIRVRPIETIEPLRIPMPVFPPPPPTPPITLDSLLNPPPPPPTPGPVPVVATCAEKCREGITNVQLALLLTATNVSSFLWGRSAGRRQSI